MIDIIQPHETQLLGEWIVIGGKVEGDETTKRIRRLVSTCLEHVATSDDGWSMLYRDKNDGRYWELTYPHSDWHGGGPPSLTLLESDEILKRYPGALSHM